MGKKKEADTDLDTEDLLQAIVLVDSFSSQFHPVTLEMPKALIPLVNVPMLEYTLEFLAASGVQEIFVFSSTRTEEMEAYLSTAKTSIRLSSVKIHSTKARAPCYSAGDALREMMSLGVIKSDFVLVPGATVANLNLAPILAAHMARREKDKEAIVTTVFQQLPVNHRIRAAGQQPILTLDGTTNQLLMYDVGQESASTLFLDDELLKEHKTVNIRQDLYDTHIDICAPEFLAVIADEFDWQDLRKDVLNGIISSEIMSYSLYAHIAEDAYAAVVNDWRTYDAISKDIIHRWTFPLVPDRNLLDSQTYKSSRGNVYKEAGVALPRSCQNTMDTVIGAGCVVGENSTVVKSVLGPGCVIGANVTIRGAYLWDGVVVKDGATVTEAVLASGVQVLEGAKVLKGTVLGPKVVVSAGFTVPEFAQVTMAEPDDDEDEDDEDDDSEEEGEGKEEAAAADTLEPSEVVGTAGEGRLYKVRKDGHCIGHPQVVPSLVDENSEDEESDEEDEEGEAAMGDDERFEVECTDTVRRGLEEKHSVDNIILEVNGLKFAYDRTFSECAAVILPTLLEATEGLDKKPDKKQLLASTRKQLNTWGGLLKKFVTNEKEEVLLINEFAAFCEEHADFMPVARDLFHHMYDKVEVLSEEAILKWHEGVQAGEHGDAAEKLDKASEAFIQWLEEEEDDDDDDED